ncbi:MAG TPA: carboxypeptidase regulatory-like domain-containing protein [Bryobacteraceae bacterium]|nr:carboxypeptidase regulatory-like domain-containing protein [Bryobacteraceae bacterium]
MSVSRNSFALMFGALAGLYAQSNLNQQISGQVIDPTGAVLTGAVVVITDQNTGLTRMVTTNLTGHYVVPDLPTSPYQVACEAPGFKKEVIRDNLLATNVSIEVNCKLEVGRQTEAVNVHADVVTVETTNGDVGYTVTGEQAGELQLNGRNFPELLQLLPGVSTTYADGFSLFGGYGLNNSGQSINGGRTDTTTWNLDGGDNKDNGGAGNNFININPNAIGEFRVLTSNFSAESGTSSGAVVNISIRSGTKKFHGMLYEYWRNDHLAANVFNAAVVGKPKLRWNNFGGNFGGPVLVPHNWLNRNHDKLFFFFSEDLKYLRQGYTTTWTVPTAAFKSGSFGTTNIKDPSTQTPFPGNVVPAARINPDMQKLIDIYPAANSGTASFIFNETQPTNVHQEVVKVDYNLNEKNQFSVHWAHDHYNQLENYTNLIEYYRNIPGLNSSVQWNHVFAPTLINVTQFTYTGNVITEQNDVVPNRTFIDNYTRQGFGIGFPSLYNASPDIPQIAVQNYTTLSVSPLTFNNFNRIFDWKESLTKILGNHTLKAGILIMRSRKNQDNPPQINGAFAFSNARTPTSGNAVADALLGDFQQYQEYSGVREGWYRFWQVEPWLQDDWKVGSRLTINLGLRWSYMQPQYSALNNTVQFLPQSFNPAGAAVINPSNGSVTNAPNPYNGLVLDGPGFPAAARGRVDQYNDPVVQALFHNLPLGGAYTRWGNVGPRFGFAYDLTGKQTTVLRGGFGVAYERVQGNFIFSAINNTPFNGVSTFLNGDVEDPGQGTAGAVSVQTITNSHFLDMKDPRSMTWSLGVQRKVTANTMLTVSYVGQNASNLSFIYDPNQPVLGYSNTVFVPGTKTVANANASRPYLGYGNIQEYDTGANFIYDSLQTLISKRTSQAGILSAAFTWAKGRTDANSFNYQPEDSHNLRNDWGTSNYSRNKVLTTSWVYPLPFWREGGTWYRQTFGGWQVNGTGLFQTGLPVNITDSNTGLPGVATDVGSGLRPNLIGNPYAGGAVNGFQILNPTAFANPASNTWGNLGAYNVFLPRWINVNGSVSKSFWMHERYKWDVKFDMYNVANHLCVSSVGTGSFNGYKLVNGTPVSTTANWGAKSATTPPRTMEASLRLSF